MKVAVFRKAHFNAAHRLHNPNFSKEKNEEIYGKCNNANYHGHNYNLIVKVIGEIDPETGYVIDLKVLNEVIEQYVTSKLDHMNLNLDVPEFKETVPTAENIAIFIYHTLTQKLDPKFEIKVTLYETERNFVEYPA